MLQNTIQKTRDRLPPFDELAEKAIIGCCLTDPILSVSEAGLTITSDDFFYDAKCREVWKIVRLMEPSDVNTISVQGKLARIMEPSKAALFCSECQDAAFSSANLPVWLEDVQKKYILRRLIKTATESIKNAYESQDAFETLDLFERQALRIRPERKVETSFKTLIQDAQRIIEHRAQNWNEITGLSTGLVDLDKLSDGLHPGELIIIAALPSCGKTTLAINIAIHNAMQGIPVGILSAEMRPVSLLIRSICSESRVNFKRMGEDDIVKMIPVMGRMSAAPIYIQQASGWTIGQAQACARRWHQAYGIKILVPDYIQKFQGIGENREQRVASVGNGFKETAMELEIPVLAPSQLNDDGKLRESRALGQDGDTIWKLSNDGAWKADVQPVKLRIEKCRDGETGEVDLTLLKTYTRFESRSKFSDEDVAEK